MRDKTDRPVDLDQDPAELAPALEAMTLKYMEAIEVLEAAAVRMLLDAQRTKQELDILLKKVGECTDL